MDALPADFVEELYRQTAFLSAVLGGFAIAFMGALLTLTSESKTVTRTIWIAALAATLLIVATFSSTAVLLDLIRLEITSFNFTEWPASLLRSKSIADSTFFAGMYALLIAIGYSGSIRNKKTGIITGILALFGLILLTIVLRGTTG